MTLLLLGCADRVHVRLLELEKTQSVRPEPEPLEPMGAPDGAAPEPAEVTTDASQAAADSVPDASLATPEAPAAVEDGPSDAGPPDPPSATLIHHYDFTGKGTLVRDVVGGADGELIGGAELDGSGTALLDGKDDYVNLPNGLLARLKAVTLTAWVNWQGGLCWQRVFDFGGSVNGEDTASWATTSIFLAPASCDASHAGPVRQGVLTAQFHLGDLVYMAQDGAPLPHGQPSFVAVSASPDLGLTTYVDGREAFNIPAAVRVSELDQYNNWLGRSQWAADPFFAGRYDDFKIYDGVLSGPQVVELYESGVAEGRGKTGGTETDAGDAGVVDADAG